MLLHRSSSTHHSGQSSTFALPDQSKAVPFTPTIAYCLGCEGSAWSMSDPQRSQKQEAPLRNQVQGQLKKNLQPLQVQRPQLILRPWSMTLSEALVLSMLWDLFRMRSD